MTDHEHRAAAASEFRAGARAIAPILLGVFPFAMICGIAAVNIGLSPLEAMGMNVIMFAGASQLVVVQLLDEGAPALIIVLSATIVNLRFMMYSASIAPHFAGLPLRWRLGLPYILTDQGYGISILHFGTRDDASLNHWFYLGCGAVMWISWQLGALLGIVLGRGIPDSWSLDFAIPATFIAILVPAIRDRAAATALIVGGSVAVAGVGLPLNLGLPLAALCGIVAGMLVEAHT